MGVFSLDRSRLGAALLAAVAAGACALEGAPENAQTEPVKASGESVVAAGFGSPATLSSRWSGASGAGAAQDPVTESRRTAIVRAAERVGPSVVSVNVIRREAVRPRDFFESFFLPPGAQREVAGLGSGVIIREDGLVLTNEHVVRGAQVVVVTLPDGRDFDAEIVGTDEATDLALLRIPNARDLPVAPLGDSDDLMIGEWVVAIGNPFGYLLSNTEPTVTAGVVSGVGRNIIPSGDEQRGYYLDMIQTDASINPGNSGGALVNAMGEVVGVNSSIISGTGGSQGLGFAIPINRARRIVEDLLAHGRVRRAWLGFEIEGPDGTRRNRLREVRVIEVVPGSPAAEAGLRPGMVVNRIAGRRIRNLLDWQVVALDARVGEPLDVVVTDGGRERVIRVVPRDLPSLGAERIRALSDFELITLTPAIRAERGLVNEQGALIVWISGAGRRIGLREGDLILQINNQPIRSAEEAASLLRRLAGRSVRVIFERNGQIGLASFYISS